MAIIREFREDDIDLIARLHQEVFPPDSGPAPLAAYRTYFRDTFLSGPRANSGFGSLVCEERDGTLSGFLGVIPLRMALGGRPPHPAKPDATSVIGGGDPRTPRPPHPATPDATSVIGGGDPRTPRPIWAAVCTQYCVAPGRRGMTGLELMRHHFAGPQDLSITDEANTVAMRLWSWAGGEAITSCSLHFMRPLRPAQLALSLAQRPALAGVARCTSLLARLLDSALARVPHSHFRQSLPPTLGEPLDAAAMAAALPELARERQLLPHYQLDALAWRLRRAESIPGGDLERVLVRNRDGQILGWYIYRRERDGTAQLLQLTAPSEAARPVLDHLLYDAWRAGMIVLSGRLDPALAQAFSDCYCLFSRRGPWMLVHSRDPALRQIFHRGQALFSPLDGELCARFNPPAS